MKKALELGKTSAVGGFQLFIGKSMSTIIMAIGSVILGRLMLPGEYGLYTIALVPAITMTLFSDWGIDLAMTKYIAQYRAVHNEESIRDLVAVGLIFKVIIGVALSLLSLFLASFIAGTFFDKPETAPLISLAAITVLSQSLITASQANFVGFERMHLNSITMVCQSVLKSTISPLLVFVGYGAIGAVLGYTVSFVVAAILGIVLFYFSLFKNLKKSRLSRSDKIQTLKEMLRYGLPLSISTIINGFLSQFYAFMMAFYCTTVVIGNYQIASNFAMFLTFFTFPITTVLFPIFSKMDPRKELDLLKSVFKSSVKYTSMLLVPATVAVMILAGPMINTVYGEQYVDAPFFLTLYVIGNLLAGLGNLSLSTVLIGLGETKMLMKLSLLTIPLGIPLAFLLIPGLGIVGVIAVGFFAVIPSMCLGLLWIWRHYKLTVDWGSSAKIFAASAISAAITFLSLNFLVTAEWLKLIIGGIIFLAAYILVAPSIGAIVQDDITNLRKMLSSMGILLTIANLPLSIAEKVARFFSAKKN